MNLVMSGLDYSLAPIALRERLSFSGQRVGALDAALAAGDGAAGCVLLSTCNRTEVYLSLAEGADRDPGALLCAAAGVDYAPFAPAFVTRRGEDAARHLLEVTGGLKSQLWGEDQILAQVKTALDRARAAGAADPVLETLFRTAAAAGKAVKTQVRLTGVPTSAAARAVALLERDAGGLAGRRALVVGNGEMGRLVAALLREKGCAVTVTLRTYRHGETRVPAGCAVAPYEDRYRALEGMDLLVSATASPHETITAQALAGCGHIPPLMADLAIPRDIQPQVGELPGVTLYNVDDLGGGGREIPPKAAALVERHLAQLRQWDDYRACLPALARVKRAVADRLASTAGAGAPEAAAARAVDLLAGALKDRLTPADLERCAKKIEARTAARPRRRGQGQAPLRFPLFVDLSGRKAVIVGGGRVACRRAAVLLGFGARVTLIAPACPAPPPGVEWLRRPYAPGDLAGAALAVAATDDRAVNHAAGEEARARGVPVSVADAPGECTFFFPAVCVGEDVVAGVVGRGADHRRTADAAKAIRDVWEEEP